MEFLPLCSAHKAKMTTQNLLECYNVMKEEYNKEDPRNVQILETEGTCTIEGPDLLSTTYMHPKNMKNVNIRTMKNLKFA
jgi:hypothetical protein